MLQEYEIVIADTSCFILLDKIGEIELLKKVFSSVTTTQIIATEFGKRLPDWIIVLPVQNISVQKFLETEVDAGEASAFALSLEYKSPLLIIDDLKARKIAAKLLINYTGTLGVFLKAKELNIISAVKPLLDKIQLTNFRFSKKVFDEILSIANEN
jgi:predicted nucleic acid-binding protein